MAVEASNLVVLWVVLLEALGRLEELPDVLYHLAAVGPEV